MSIFIATNLLLAQVSIALTTPFHPSRSVYLSECSVSGSSVLYISSLPARGPRVVYCQAIDRCSLRGEDYPILVSFPGSDLFGDSYPFLISF
jgi:hypothetical protein